MLEKIAVGVACSVISALFVFVFITNKNKDGILKEASVMIQESVRIHNSIEHKDPMSLLVEKHAEECEGLDKAQEALQRIANHSTSCSALRDVSEFRSELNVIKISLIFLVRSAGGDPKDLGLGL